jgi:anti-sigma factor RsiW
MDHLNRTDLERMRSGALSAGEAARFGGHIAQCSECASAAGEHLDLTRTAAAFDAAFAPDDALEHPEDDVLAAYADGTIDAFARRGVDAHLRACSECSDDVAGLQRLVTTERPRRIHPLWFGAAAAAAAAMFVLPRLQNDAPAPEPPPVTTRRSVPAGVPSISVPAPPVPAPRSTRLPEWNTLVAEVRSTGVLPFPAEIRRLAATDAFRGEPEERTRGAFWPVATAIDDERPELRWPPASGARYVVSLTSEGSEIAQSGPLAVARWRTPVPLQRGRMYRWQVTVERGDESSVIPAPPAPPAIFRVITDREHQELARACADAGDDHLLLGLLYARTGMVDEARRELGIHGRASRDPLAGDLRRQLPAAP